MNKFAKRLAELRQEKGMKRADLASALSVSVRLVAFWESGARECDFDTLISLSRLFDTSIDYLLGNADY